MPIEWIGYRAVSLKSTFGWEISIFLAKNCMLQNHYPILFRGVNGTVAHEFIVDLRGFKVIGQAKILYLSVSSS